MTGTAKIAAPVAKPVVVPPARVAAPIVEEARERIHAPLERSRVSSPPDDARPLPRPPIDLSHVSIHPPGGHVLQRKCACKTPSNGECKRCKKGKPLQAKLRIGDADDTFEREADRVAERILGASGPADVSANAVSSTLSRVAAAAPSTSIDAPAAVASVLSSPGQALDRATRGFFEPRFGRDLRHVRVHTDASAAASARAVDALAYTVTDHIVFDVGQFAPGTEAGRRLLAHELAHTIQQGAGGAGPYVARQPNPEAGSREMEITIPDRPSTGDPSDAPWLVYNDGKGDKRILLPPGTRVEIQGAPARDQRGAQTLQLQRVQIISLPDGTSAPPIGTVGMIRLEFLRAAPAKAKIEDSPSEISGKAPTADPPKAEDPRSQYSPDTQRALARYDGLPDTVKWPNSYWLSRKRSDRTDVAVRMMLTARDFCCHEPYDVEMTSKLLEGLRQNFVEKYLIESNFDKVYSHLNGFGKPPVLDLMRAGRDSVNGMIGRINSGQVGPGHCGGTFDHYTNQFIASYEVMAVLAGDLEFKDASQLKAWHSISSLKPASAFGAGMLEGAKSQLGDDDYKRLEEKLADAATINLIAPQIMAAGAAVGLGKDVIDMLKLLTLTDEEILKMGEQIVTIIGMLITDEEGSRALGFALGAAQAHELAEIAKENSVTFTYKIGEKIGPMVVYAVLALFGGEILQAVAGSARLAEFLETYPRIAKNLERIKAFMPEVEGAKKAAAADGVDAATPKPKPKPGKAAVAEGAEASEAKGVAKATEKLKPPPEKDVSRIGKALEDDSAIGPVKDSKFAGEYDVEFKLDDGVTYRRKKGGGSWCRFNSPADCDIDLSEQLAVYKRAMQEYAQARGWIVEKELIEKRGWSFPKEANFEGIDAWSGPDPVPGSKPGQQLLEGAHVRQIKSVKPQQLAIEMQYDSGTKGLALTEWESSTLLVRNAKQRTLIMVVDADMSSVAEGTKTMIDTMRKSLTGGPHIKVEWYYRDLKGAYKLIE